MATVRTTYRQRPQAGRPGNYGVACNFDETGSFEYIAGVQISAFGALREAFATVRIRAQRYDVFSHH
jgi:AraC family transcriptional regulator